MAINLIQALSQRGRPMVQQQGPQNQALAQMLRQNAYSSDPIDTPMELIGRGAAAWRANSIEKKNEQAERDQYRALSDALASGADPYQALTETGNPEFMKMAVDYRLRDSLSGSKGANPRKLETLYTDTGGSYKAYYDPEKQDYVQVGGVKPPSGMNISFDENGNPVVSQGVQMGSSAQTQNQKDLISADELYARLESIEAQTKPEFMTLGGKVERLIGRLQANVDPNSLSKEQWEALSKFQGWKSETMSNLQRYMKDISGAAVNESEYNRLAQTMPSPDMDFVTFMSALERWKDMAKATVERAMEREKRGLSRGSPTGNPADLSNISDEELRAIAGQ